MRRFNTGPSFQYRPRISYSASAGELGQSVSDLVHLIDSISDESSYGSEDESELNSYEQALIQEREREAQRRSNLAVRLH